MKKAIYYEWDIETRDGDGDIIDHYHAERLELYGPQLPEGELVLIRNAGNERDGLTDRTWAYVKDGSLPEYFCDAEDTPVYKVPAQFKKELKAYQTTTP